MMRRPSISDRLLGRFSDAVVRSSDAPAAWQYLFLSLPLGLRIALVQNAATFHVLTPASWATLGQPVAYTFQRSWHRWTAGALLVGASIVAMAGVVQHFDGNGLVTEVVALLAGLALVAGCTWWFANREFAEPFDALLLLTGPLNLMDGLTRESLSVAGFVPALAWFGTSALSTWGASTLQILLASVCLVVLWGAILRRAEWHDRNADNPFRGLDLSPAQPGLQPATQDPDAVLAS
jgi:hypothetical protein